MTVKPVAPKAPKAIKTNQFSMVNLPCSDPLNFLQPSLFVCVDDVYRYMLDM